MSDAMLTIRRNSDGLKFAVRLEGRSPHNCDELRALLADPSTITATVRHVNEFVPAVVLRDFPDPGLGPIQLRSFDDETGAFDVLADHYRKQRT